MRDEPLPRTLIDQIPQGQFLTIPQIATFLEINLRAAYRLAERERFPTFRMSSHKIRVLRVDFITYLLRGRKWKYLRKDPND